jgi:hypothetical protein
LETRGFFAVRLGKVLGRDVPEQPNYVGFIVVILAVLSFFDLKKCLGAAGDPFIVCSELWHGH